MVNIFTVHKTYSKCLLVACKGKGPHFCAVRFLLNRTEIGWVTAVWVFLKKRTNRGGSENFIYQFNALFLCFSVYMCKIYKSFRTFRSQKSLGLTFCVQKSRLLGLHLSIAIGPCHYAIGAGKL